MEGAARTATRIGAVDAVEELAKIPPERVRAMQLVIADHAHTLHYATADLPPPMDDAFTTSLRGLWRRSQATGRR